MPNQPVIAIVGPGRLGTTLALALKQSGFRIKEIVSRNSVASKANARTTARITKARLTTAATARLDANLIWFCVPDREIIPAARKLASATNWKGKLAFHSSGALPSDALDLLRRKGATVASIHPMMTFVTDAIPSLKAVPFGLEGDRPALSAARRIVRALGGQAFAVRKENKTAYHAWATFASPLLIAVLVTAEQAARAAGFSPSAARKTMLPILKQTLANYANLGPGKAFSGPLVRGDTSTVARHLRSLEKLPPVRDAYIALVRASARKLPMRNRRALLALLRTGK